MKITAKDVREAKSIEERGKLAMAYFRQSMQSGLRDNFGFIDEYVTALEKKLADVREIVNR
jgi:hypothetical protein